MTISTLLLSLVVGGANPDAVLLDFTATWCGPCQQMSPIVSRLEREGFPIKKVDVDENRELSRRYRIESIPAFVLVVDGKEVSRVVGMTSESQLRRLLSRIPKPKPDIVLASKERPVPDQARHVAAVDSSAEPAVKKKLGFSFPFFSNKSEKTKTPPVVRAKFDDDHELTASKETNNPIAASTRIRVKDSNGVNFGSGTIIDSRPGRTLILTCGHVLRNLKKDSTIEVDVFGADGRSETYLGEAVRYNLEADVGLLAIPTDGTLSTAKVATVAEQVHQGDFAFSVGCGGGERPTKEQLRVTALNRYLGPDNIECTGVPIQGRSGGGLFNTEGKVIGVCIAADPKDKRGLYAGLKAVHALLDETGLTRLYREVSPQTPRKFTRDSAVEFADFNSQPQSSPADFAPFSESLSPEVRAAEAVFDATVQYALSSQPQAGVESVDDTEVVCIIRSKSNPTETSRVVILNSASPRFVSFLTEELDHQVQQANVRNNRPSRTDNSNLFETNDRKPSAQSVSGLQPYRRVSSN